MSVKVAIFRCAEIKQRQVFPDLDIAIEVEVEQRTVGDVKNGKLVNKRQIRVYNADIRPEGAPNEPMWTTLKGRAGLKSSNRHLEGRAAIMVTRRRVLLHIGSGLNAKGLETRSGSDQVAVLSVDRSDLGPPQISRKMMGGIKRVEFSGATEPFTLLFPSVSNFDRLLELMSPEGAEQLGDAAAARVRAAKRSKEALAQEAAVLAEAEKQRVNAARFARSGTESAPSLGGRVTGVLDHRRTWRYAVNAPPSECVDAFAAAFSGPGGLVAKAKWAVRRNGDGGVAVYQGRKGVGALGSIVSNTAALEAETALGSEVNFEIDGTMDGRTLCKMWLSSSGAAGIGGLLGATSDARFIRPYMRAVESQLRQVDASLQIVKD